MWRGYFYKLCFTFVPMPFKWRVEATASASISYSAESVSSLIIIETQS